MLFQQMCGFDTPMYYSSTLFDINAFYAAGLGCVPWQANEFLAMEVRSMGIMFINMFM